MNKVALLEREGNAAFSKIAVLEMENVAASSKIQELEKEKEDTTRKIALLEKELEIKEEKFGNHKNAQLQKEEELRTKFEDFKSHTNVERKMEKDAAMCKIAMLEKELETTEVRAYKQAVRTLREIQELTITMQRLTEERQYWETLAEKLKAKESEASELVESRKEMDRVVSTYYSYMTNKTLWNSGEGRKATLTEAICFMGEKLKEAKIKDTGFVKVDQLKPRTDGINLIVKVLNTNLVVDKNQNTRQQSLPSYRYYQGEKVEITRVAESLVGDETGTIIFTACNEQVDLMDPEPVEFVVNEDEDCNKSLVEYEVIRKHG